MCISTLWVQTGQGEISEHRVSRSGKPKGGRGKHQFH